MLPSCCFVCSAHCSVRVHPPVATPRPLPSLLQLTLGHHTLKEKHLPRSEMQQEATSTLDLPRDGRNLPTLDLPMDSSPSLMQRFLSSESDETDHEAFSNSSSEVTSTPVDLTKKTPSPPLLLQESPDIPLYMSTVYMSSAFTRPPPKSPLRPQSDSSNSPTVESFADVHVCPYCSRRFKYKNNLSTHIKNKHKQDNQACACEACGKHFSSKASMNFHINKFHRPQVLSCKLCPQRFTLPGYLNAHMKAKHPYSACEFCCEPVFPEGKYKAHLIDSTCPMCHAHFWCFTFKQEHLRNTTCGAKVALLENFMPPLHLQMMMPPPLPLPPPPPPTLYPFPNFPMMQQQQPPPPPQEQCSAECLDCARPPPPTPPHFETQQQQPPPSPPLTCHICGQTFSDMGSLGFHVGVVHVGMGHSYAAGMC